MNPKRRMEWMKEQHLQEMAGKQADELVLRLKACNPVDPLAVARSEEPLLRAGGRNLGNRYDGKLEYHRRKNCFLLFFNTKYDSGLSPGEHHPRTRFSIGHELGHFFLDHHRAYLMRGGKPHRSTSEYLTELPVEREADSFAASLLLPTHLVRPIVNQAELSVDRIAGIARDFGASVISTAIRCVRLSHFPCAVAGIRDGEVAWMFPSEAVIEGGFYPKKGHLPSDAESPWVDFQAGAEDVVKVDGYARHWFQTYEHEHLESVYVTEEYVPVHVLGTLLVLLTMDENDVSPDDEDWDHDGD
jgi:hypothetical protein